MVLKYSPHHARVSGILIAMHGRFFLNRYWHLTLQRTNSECNCHLFSWWRCTCFQILTSENSKGKLRCHCNMFPDGSGHVSFQILTLKYSKNKLGMLDTPMPFVFLMAVHANIYGYWRGKEVLVQFFSGDIQMFPLQRRVLKGMTTHFQIKLTWVRFSPSAVGVFPKMWMNLLTYF